MDYNFNKIISRENTGSVKGDYEITKEIYKGMPKDFVAMWVADMDFETAPSVTNAIKKRSDHKIYGYSKLDDEVFKKIIWWQKTRHNVDMKEEDFIAYPGIVSGLSAAVRSLTSEGDGVIICQPVYNPFENVISTNNRKVINNPLIEKDNYYTMDFEDLEEKAKEKNTKMMILCNPHNPVGRVWEKEEIKKVLDICLKNDVILLSDEIHCDLIIGDKKHVGALSIDEKYEDIVVVMTSITKTFNLASMGIGYSICKNKEINEKLQKEVDSYHFIINSLAIAALKGAYTKEGAKWVDDLCRYLKNNFDFLKDYVDNNFDKAKIGIVEGTYLAWLDLREYKVSSDILMEKMTKAGVLLSDGKAYGEKGEGFLRVNFATPKENIEKALHKIFNVLKSL